MLSKNKIKFVNALFLKKNRDEQQLFCAEGEKCVTELIKTFECKTLIATNEWLLTHALPAEEIISVETTEEIKKVSFFKTPSPVTAIFKRKNHQLTHDTLQNNLVLVLDGVQDPGNMGTIVRIADWFGIRHVVCLEQTVDVYNPKAVQATMGALARVKMHYVTKAELFTLIKHCKTSIPVYGTFLEGENIYSAELTKNGIIVMGNEGNGISDEVKAHVTRKLIIPNYPQGCPTSESLNVAIATGIVCSEFRRRL